MKHVKCYQKGYPRPQFVRKDWQSLDGEWAFGFGVETLEKDALSGKLGRKIVVPFSYETIKSTVNDPTMSETVWYAREIGRKKGKRTLLHFEGVDYDTTVYINGKIVGTHRGAYARFSFDITAFLTKERNILTVRCDDKNHPTQVRGKQRWEERVYGCWYVQTTGIWKSVWLEYVENVHLTSLKITPRFCDYSVKLDFAVNAPADDVEVLFEISYDGMPIQTVRARACDVDNSLCVCLSSGKRVYQCETWGISRPNLYDLKMSVFKTGKKVDEVGSYFALREYTVKGDKILLNGRPFYARLVLDQGYWQESGLTPPDEEALIRDITLAQEMGFNGVRKHQKVEDERYLYYADILGFTVWCELPSNHWQSDETAAQITREWMDIVRQNYNHPSVVTWVVFNESWGVRNIRTNAQQQNLATALYYLTKAFDTMRPVISNDGWEHTVSDIFTLHQYEQDADKLYRLYESRQKMTGACPENDYPLPLADGYEYRGQPIIISEFGGTAYVRDEDKGWGYGNGVKCDEEFLNRFGSLVAAIDRLYISGYCYTQLSDVEQEVNGLLYEDRTPKVPLAQIASRNKS